VNRQRGRTGFSPSTARFRSFIKAGFTTNLTPKLAGKIYNPNMMMDFYEDPDGTVYFTFRNGAISVAT
jgi:hypothetical protein